MSSVGSILTNTGALDALQSISTTSTENNTLEGEMSSGLSINSPANNPAGYITAQGFTSQLNGLTQAISNANTGVSLLQTAQGALQQQIGIVQQLNSTAVQAANGTETAQEGASLQSVVSQLVGQVSGIASQTQFNGVSLLNGTFNNVQFQVGSNEGQTMQLSIANTSASNLGMYETNALASTATSVTSTAEMATSGAFATTAMTFTVGGTSLGSVTPTAISESAASLASQINAVTGTQGMTATASNVFNAGTVSGTGSTLSLTLAASGGGTAIGTSYQATGTSLATLMASINEGTSQTGISATTDSNNDLILTQAGGDNMQLTGLTASGTTLGNISGDSSAMVQGAVQLQAASQITIGGTSPTAGISATTTFVSLASINVSSVNGDPTYGGTYSSTTGAATYDAALNQQGGANQAINVVKYALDSLNNAGGELGAQQQGLTANINNLNTTSENVTSALGTVQDANLPQVANQLTQAQIQAQAGVAALKSSTTLQQSYLSLLP